MTNNAIDQLGRLGSETAMRAAAEFLRVNGIKVSGDAELDRLVAVIREHVVDATAAAIEDAREAFACNMREIGQATFVATLKLAGIRAAKAFVAAA